MDIIYAVDSSAYVTPDELEHIKNYVKAASRLYEISVDNTHVGIATYGMETVLSLSLKDGTNPNSVLIAVNNLKAVGGPSYIDKMISYIGANGFSVANGMRAKSKRLLVIITKGNTKDSLSVNKNVLESNNVKVAVVSIGKQKDEKLKDIYDDNKISYVVWADELPSVYPDIEGFIATLLGKMFSSWNLLTL